jgi:hypothetical protein
METQTNALVRVIGRLLLTSIFLLAGCSHTERITREMTWSTESQVRGLRALPEEAVRLTFVQAPKFHAGLVIPGLSSRLRASGKAQVMVSFQIRCKHRMFSLIRIRSVDGVPVETRSDNMWIESSDVVPGRDPGPFPGACSY